METITYTTKAARIAQAKPLTDLQIMQAIAPRKSTIHILESVCIRDGIAYVTDLDLWGSCPAPAGLADGMYTIAGGCMNRNSQDMNDYPHCKLPDADITAAVELPLGNVWAALNACRSTDMLRLALCGVNLQMVPGTTYATATDGHVLAVRDLHALPLMAEGATILMPRLCDLLHKMRGHGSALLHVTAEHQIAYIGAWTLVAPIVEGIYPNVERVIPVEAERHTLFNRAELIAALTALKPFAGRIIPRGGDPYKTVSAWFNPDKLDDEAHGLTNVLWTVEDIDREFHKGATVGAAHCNGIQAMGKGESTLIMSVNTEGMEQRPAFKLNIDYLLSLLTTTEAATVRLDWNGPDKCFILHFE